MILALAALERSIRNVAGNNRRLQRGQNVMKNKKWKKFQLLTEECYNNMIGFGENNDCWKQAFELLMEIVMEERKQKPGFAAELEKLEEETDYAYDVSGWLEDCLDEIDMRGEQEILLKMCENLLDLFGWPEYTGSDLKIRKVFALLSLGKYQEAVSYFEKWLKKEPENITAAAAGIYVYIAVKDYEKGQELIDRFILNPNECTDENDIIFTAASKFYEATGNKKAKKQIDKALKAYEEYLEKYFNEMDDELEFGDEDDFEFDEEDLPFN